MGTFCGSSGAQSWHKCSSVASAPSHGRGMRRMHVRAANAAYAASLCRPPTNKYNANVSQTHTHTHMHVQVLHLFGCWLNLLQPNQALEARFLLSPPMQSTTCAQQRQHGTSFECFCCCACTCHDSNLFHRAWCVQRLHKVRHIVRMYT